MPKVHGFTLLVNSCDSFSDCWDAFFGLLDRYWAKPLPPILLNTELKDYHFGEINLATSKVQSGVAEQLPWGQCLERSLQMITTPLVLYLQEDYFIERQVDVAMIGQISDWMMANEAIAHVGLTNFGSSGPFADSPYHGLGIIDRRARYRVSTQAGLWRTDALRSYVKSWESGWMFELFGTVRAWRKADLFLTIREGHPAPISYQHTGIIKGQWSKFVPALFAAHGIDVDYSQRGFFEDPGALRRRWGLARLIAKNPRATLRSLIAK